MIIDYFLSNRVTWEGHFICLNILTQTFFQTRTECSDDANTFVLNVLSQTNNVIFVWKQYIN